MNSSLGQSADLCFVCALAEEAEAVRTVFQQFTGAVFRDGQTRQGHSYLFTTIKNHEGTVLTIVVSWMPRMGPQSLTLHLRPLLEEFMPPLAIMTGICAGDRRRVTLGDLIVANRTFTYDSGKVTLDAEGHQVMLHNAMTWQMPSPLLQRLQMFSDWQPAVAQLKRPQSLRQQREWLLNQLLDTNTSAVNTIPRTLLEMNAPEWRRIVGALSQGSEALLTSKGTLRSPARIRKLVDGVGVFPYVDPPHVQQHIKSLASGSAVRSDNPFAFIQIPVRDTVGIDMEGAAFCETVAEFPGMQALVVKGVSDYADQDKDDTYHEFAAQASALYALIYIQRYGVGRKHAPQNPQIVKVIDHLAELEQSTQDHVVLDALQTLNQVLTRSEVPRQRTGRALETVIQRLNLPFKTAAGVLALRSVFGKSMGLPAPNYYLEELLADKTQVFVGREYVFTAIDRFIAAHAHGYFTIVGDPGMGKSTIMAEYLRRTGCIAHFNMRALGIISVQQFLEHVCTQLIVDFDLHYATLPSEATRDGTFFSQLLSDASAKLTPGERIIILVDALDEVEQGNQSPGSNILYLPTTLPNQVYIILTRRNDPVPLMSYVPDETIDLVSHPAENRRDVELYVRAHIARPGIQAWIQQRQLQQDDFIHILVDLSENNFMYLRLVLPEIEAGTYHELNIEALPKGLINYYKDHWRRMGMTASPLPKDKLRIIYVMCEVKQPVSRQLLADFASNPVLKIDELDVQAVLDEWIQFLHIHRSVLETKYSLYHATFREFLHSQDIVRAAEVTIEGINKLIADNLWNDLFGDT